MWPRYVELALALWLASSVLVFGVPRSETTVWAVDFGAALVVGLSSLACYRRRRSQADFVTLAVAVALAAYGLGQPRPIESWHQNHILIGLLLAMFAVLPTPMTTRPQSWKHKRGAQR